MIGSIAISQVQSHTQQSTVTGRTIFAGSVYISGEDFEKDSLYVDTSGGLLATIEAIEPPPSGRENAIVNQGNGNCVPRKFPAKNGTADFKTTTFPDGESIVTKRSEFYEEVTSAITITAIKHTTSVGSSQAVTSNRHTSYFESLEGMFFNSENNSGSSLQA